MNLRRTTIEKLVFTDIPSLDPVTVMIDDVDVGRGSITICCYGEAWTAYLGAMGNLRIVEFFCRADPDYLAGKLSSVPSTSEIDYDVISRDIGEDVDVTTAMLHTDKLAKHYGDDWMMDLPQRPNPKYTYLVRIIRAVQDGLREHIIQPLERASA